MLPEATSEAVGHARATRALQLWKLYWLCAPFKKRNWKQRETKCKCKLTVVAVVVVVVVAEVVEVVVVAVVATTQKIATSSATAVG